MRIMPLAAVAVGYALLYYALNVLVDAYFRTGAPMNPAPMTVLLGIQQLSGTVTGGNSPTPDQPAEKAGGE